MTYAFSAWQRQTKKEEDNHMRRAQEWRLFHGTEKRPVSFSVPEDRGNARSSWSRNHQRLPCLGTRDEEGVDGFVHSTLGHLPIVWCLVDRKSAILMGGESAKALLSMEAPRLTTQPIRFQYLACKEREGLIRH